jgi:hypothetical protein
MQNLDRIISILFSLKLNKAIALMLIRDLIPGYVHIDNRTRLQKQFPYDLLVDSLLEVAYVDRGLLVAFEQGATEAGQRGVLVHV